MRTVVIGLGNPLRADDAVGLHVARAVRARPEAAGCDVEELWAGGLRLAEALSGYDRAVVVDALAGDGVAPGELRRLRLDQLGDCRTTACAHDATLPAALELWRRAGEPVPGTIAVIGIGAADLASLAERLTPAVAAAVPAAVELVLAELAGPGREERP